MIGLNSAREQAGAFLKILENSGRSPSSDRLIGPGFCRDTDKDLLCLGSHRTKKLIFNMLNFHSRFVLSGKRNRVGSTKISPISMIRTQLHLEPTQYFAEYRPEPAKEGKKK